MKDKVFIIAEAGVNHNGDMNMARKLIDVAFESGADCVKFQSFKTGQVVTKSVSMAQYQIQNMGETGSQLEMLKTLELSLENHKLLTSYCKEKPIKFLSTPFDVESLHLLVDQFHLKRVKISSGDLTNSLLLFELARKNVNVILSTGMGTLSEIELALGILALGYTNPGVRPSLEKFKEAFSKAESQAKLREKVILLHCVSNYPASYDEINLRAMETIKNAFGLPVGFSDHSLGIAVPIAAAALGAKVIEKHFTLDRNLPGPDHKASLEPHDLKAMVTAIRQVEQALGSSEKRPSPAELKVAEVARRSLVASKAINRGQEFTLDNLTVKRPSSGISPLKYWDYLGQRASRDYNEDDLID